MFEKYVIVDNSLRSTSEGWAVDLRIPYYRGLGLSMVSLQIELNGQRITPDQMTVELPGRSYPLTELPGIVEDRWGFGETLTVKVREGSVLKPGAYEVGVTVGLRVSYLPVPSVTTVRRTMAINQEAKR
jgi:Domain of unknown function (DUF6379)